MRRKQLQSSPPSVPARLSSTRSQESQGVIQYEFIPMMCECTVYRYIYAGIHIHVLTITPERTITGDTHHTPADPRSCAEELTLHRPL